MIFIARYNDGSCGIADAIDEAKARELLLSDGAYCTDDDRIISLRPLANAFVSRWAFNDKDSKESLEVDHLSGMLGEQLTDEIFDHEYPMISAAHATVEHEVPFFKRDIDMTEPIDVRHVRQMGKWERNLVRRLRQAIKLEMERHATPKQKRRPTGH
jgi:hypothetical protein